MSFKFDFVIDVILTLISIETANAHCDSMCKKKKNLIQKKNNKPYTTAEKKKWK